MKTILVLACMCVLIAATGSATTKLTTRATTRRTTPNTPITTHLGPRKKITCYSCSTKTNKHCNDNQFNSTRVDTCQSEKYCKILTVSGVLTRSCSPDCKPPKAPSYSMYYCMQSLCNEGIKATVGTLSVILSVLAAFVTKQHM